MRHEQQANGFAGADRNAPAARSLPADRAGQRGAGARRWTDCGLSSRLRFAGADRNAQRPIATLTEQASAAQGAQEQIAGYEQQLSSLQGEVEALRAQATTLEALRPGGAALYKNLDALRQAQEIPGVSVYQDANTGETVDPLLPKDATGTPIPDILPD